MILNLFLLAMVLAFGIKITVMALLQRQPMSWFGWSLILFIGSVAAFAVTTIRSDDLNTIEQEVSANRPVAIKSDGYVSSDKCRSCHPEQYDSWHHSHHRTMTQVPTSESVIADFDDHVVSRSGIDFRFFEEEDGFFMELKNKKASTSGKPQTKTFKIALSTGSHHQQAFWCETENGRTLGNIPFIWINSEKRWVPYGSIFLIPSSGLSMHAGVWNRNCIKCHVVGGQPRHDAESVYDSHVAEFGISCEACHGPGESHIAAHRNPLSRYRQHFSPDDDPTMISPADLDHVRSSQVCGQCHSIFEFYDEQGREDFNQNGFAFRPGDDLLDSRHVFRMGHGNEKTVVKKSWNEIRNSMNNNFGRTEWFE